MLEYIERGLFENSVRSSIFQEICTTRGPWESIAIYMYLVHTVLCTKNANEFRRNSPFVYTNSHFSKLRDFAASPFEEISLCRMKICLQPRKFTHLQTIFQCDFVNSRTKIQIAYRKLLILKEVLFSCNNWRNLLQTKTLFWNCTIVNLLLV